MDCRYAAGLFDGEGSVSITVARRKNCSPLHLLKVDVTISHEEVLRNLQQTFGGSVYRGRERKMLPGNWIWHWSVNGPVAAAFLKRIRAHVVVKRPQLELALEFQAARGDHRGRKKGHTYGTPPDELERREIYRQRMWALNGLRLNRKPL